MRTSLGIAVLATGLLFLSDRCALAKEEPARAKTEAPDEAIEAVVPQPSQTTPSEVRQDKPGPAEVQPEAAGAEGDYAGNEACASCHEKEAQQFAKSLHGRLALDKEKSWDSGCESCHGPGKAHVNADGDPSKILNPKKISPEQSAEKCLACHAKDRAQLFWDGSPHQAKDVACVQCHSMHQPKTPRKLLAKPSQAETCFQCHFDQKKMMHQRSRHPIAEGKVACSDCHNPHGAQGDKLISANSVNEKCFQCHAEKRGPFLWEHGPVREDCMTCHQPHGSIDASMLKAKVPRLCQSCHIQGRHQTVSGAPNAAWVVSGGCLNCHTNIHGSNHPSGQIFQR